MIKFGLTVNVNIMISMLPKWETNNEELQRKLQNEIIARVQEIDDTSTIGVIAAQDIIDIVAENLGPEIYNKAIFDVKKLIADKLADIEVDLSALEQEDSRA